MNRIARKTSRRRFLTQSGKFAAIAAAVGGPSLVPGQLLAQGPAPRIREVRAYPIYMDGRSEGLLDAPSFSGDEDLRRWRYGGPFEQLPSAIIAVIKTDQGITGFGMGAGGSAAVEIIDGHLSHLLLDANPLNVEQLWDQMYTSGIFYGRRGLFVMALSALDNALWDIAGKHAGLPVHELLGGADRDTIEIYQTNGDFAAGKAAGGRYGCGGYRVEQVFRPGSECAILQGVACPIWRVRESGLPWKGQVPKRHCSGHPPQRIGANGACISTVSEFGGIVNIFISTGIR